MWDVKEPTHYSKRIGHEVPGVVAVLREGHKVICHDYYVPPSINKVYTTLVVSGSIFSDFSVCFDFPLIPITIALNTRKMEH